MRQLSPSTRASPKCRLGRLLALLAVAVLVPSMALLWLLDRALTSERTALEQQFRSLCQDHLESALARWEKHWQVAEDHWSSSTSVAELLSEPLFSAAAKVDPDRNVITYPQLEARQETSLSRHHPLWGQARWLEFNDRGFATAAQLYATIENDSPGSEARAAWQGRVRCLVKEDQPERALALWRNTATAPEGCPERWETALFLAQEGIPPEAATELRAGVRNWLANESGSASHIPVSKRLFMMDTLAEGGVPCATRSSEMILTAQGTVDLPANPLVLEPAHNGFWMMLSSDRRSLIFIDPDSVMKLTGSAPADPLPITLLAPGEQFEALVDRSLTGPLRGWQIAISPEVAGNPALERSRASNLVVWIAWLALAASALVAAWLCRAIFEEARLNRLKNDFLAAVSHELKTPVTAIGLLVENLERKGVADHRETRDYLALIGKENDRLRRLIDNFLSFSRMERQKEHFSRDPVALQDIMKAAVITMRERYPDASQEIIEAPPTGALYLEGDREALTTVLINLLDNALKYSREDIRLDLEQLEEQVAISISDRGIGMTPEEKHHAFDKFYRADPSLTNDAPGVGLGLSIVDFVVRAHRGEVTVDSEPGEGSRFTVLLPLSPNLNDSDAAA